MLKTNNISNWTARWAKKENISYQFFKKISSTNDAAKASNNNLSLELFIAESQTQGRGRKARIWLNSDLMISWKIKAQKPPQPHTILLMSQALKKALIVTWPELPFKIKKPNDIYIKEKKLAGLLVEAVSEGSEHWLIIGIGMNVFSAPKIEFAYIQNYLKVTLSEKKWMLFLSEWQRQVAYQLPFCLTKNEVKR